MSTMTDLPDSAIVLSAGYGGDFDDQGSSSSLTFAVAGGDRNAFLTAVAGLPQQITYSNGTKVTRLIPLKHPDNYNQYASGIRESVPDDSIAFPTPNGGIIYDFHHFEVRFTTPTFAFDGSEPMITQTRSIASEMTTVPGTGYIFPSDGTYVGHDVGYPVQVVDYELTFHRLPSLNNSLYDSLAGCVNSVAFNGIAIGCCLYLGCSDTGQLTLGGQSSFEAAHRFQTRSIPWNQIMRPDGKGFEAPVQAIDGKTLLIPQADLNQLYS